MAGDDTGGRVDEDHPLTAEESLALIESQQREVHRRLVVTGTRAGRGVRGPSRMVGAMYGWSWTLGFSALAAVNIGVTRLGLPADAVTLLWSGSALLLVGFSTWPVGHCGRTGSSTAWVCGCW